jgi:hypothetical protein
MKLTLKVDTQSKLRQAMPSVEAQLAEIWRLLDAMKVQSPLLDQIKAFKAKYPKPAK